MPRSKPIRAKRGANLSPKEGIHRCDVQEGCLAQRIARQPAPGNRIVGAILRQIEPAVGVVEHAGIVEVGERRGALQRIAEGCNRKPACSLVLANAAHRADLVGAVVIRLRRRAGNVFTLGKIFARHGIAGIARLADAPHQRYDVVTVPPPVGVEAMAVRRLRPS